LRHVIPAAAPAADKRGDLFYDFFCGDFFCDVFGYHDQQICNPCGISAEHHNARADTVTYFITIAAQCLGVLFLHPGNKHPDAVNFLDLVKY